MIRITTICAILAVPVVLSCADPSTGPISSDPAEEGRLYGQFSGEGSVPNVTGFAVDVDASQENIVTVIWDDISLEKGSFIEGYRLYYRTDDQGSWTEQAELPPGTMEYSHIASAAGGYGIVAFEGGEISPDMATVSTMPSIITTTYTIWNNWCPPQAHSGFIFGPTSGTTGFAVSTSFLQDIYCYDGGQVSFTWFFSGDFGPFGNGNHTEMYEHTGNYAMPTGSAWSHGAMSVGDVIFAELNDGYWVKVYINALPHYEGGATDAFGIQFYYDWQPIRELYLFSTDQYHSTGILD